MLTLNDFEKIIENDLIYQQHLLYYIDTEGKENLINDMTNELIEIEKDVKKDSDEFYKNIIGFLFLTDIKKPVFLSEDISKMIIWN